MATGPTFSNPPVVEVICGVQFQDLPGWSTAQFGRFWSTVASDYPDTEDQPPLPKRLMQAPAPRPEVQILEFPPLRRVFFKESSGRHLIQIQSDRFHLNWRKANDDDPYPRFTNVYSRFEGAWERFISFLKQHHFDEPALQLWELTYMNHIMGDDAIFPADVWDFLSFYKSSPEAITAKDAKGERLQVSNTFLHFDWELPEKICVLSLDVRHGTRVPDQKQILALELTCRGKIEDSSLNLYDRFEVGHNAIVNTFEKLTTERGHNMWGETE